MVADTITSADLAVIELYTPAAARVLSTFDVVRKRAEAALKDMIKTPVGVQFASDGLCVWEYAYFLEGLLPSQRARWFAFWGIAFPGHSEWWRNTRPPERSAVVGISGYDEKASSIPMPVKLVPPSMIPEGWQKDDQDLVTFRPFYGFDISNGEELAEALAEWVATRLAAVPTLLEHLRETARSQPS